MTKFLERLAQIFNWGVGLYLLLITIIAFNGRIAFGHGLGDIVYLAGLSITTTVYLSANMILYREKYIDIRLFSNAKRHNISDDSYFNNT